MAKQNPGYYGILPATVRYDKNLKPMARILYTEISALSNATGECSASNKYFADLYEVNITTVSEWVKQLVDGGYITTVVDFAAGNKRKIRIPITKIPKTSSEKAEDPSSEKAEDNNTRVNNSFNNESEKNPEEIEGTEQYALARQRTAVYELYLKRFKVGDGIDLQGAKARYRLTPGRREAIDRRLKDAGYKMVCAAIIGYANEEWTHLGKGNRPDWQADLEKYILRKYEIVEEGANRYEQQKKNGGASDDAWKHLT